MIAKDSLKTLLKSLYYSDDEIADLVDSEDEKEISLKPEVKVYDEKGLATLKDNLKKGNITAGMEIMIKNLKEKTGLEYDGKDPDTFIEHFTTKVKNEANVKPTELTARYEAEKKALQAKLDEKDNTLKTLQSQIETERNEKTMLAAFPKGERIMSDNDLLLLAKNKIQANQVGDKIVYSYNGKEMKDDHEEYLPLEAVMNHVFTSEKWVKEAAGAAQPPRGAGLGDSLGNGKVFKSTAEITAHLEAKGISVLSQEGREFLNEAVKSNPAIAAGK